MGRPRKEGSIPLNEFLRTRDSRQCAHGEERVRYSQHGEMVDAFEPAVVTGLTTLNGVINDLLKAYIDHTNVLVRGGSGKDLNTLAISNLLGEVGSGVTATLAAGAAQAPTTERKKRASKKKRDPNAPRPPPTAYFFFTQSARPLIKERLGPTARGDEVTAECAKTWNELSPEKKEEWKARYRERYAEYKKQLEIYNAKKAEEGASPIPDVVPEEVDLDAVTGATDVDASSDDDSSDDSDSSDDDEDTPPPKQPSPPPAKAGKKSKAGKDKGNNEKTNGITDSQQSMKSMIDSIQVPGSTMPPPSLPLAPSRPEPKSKSEKRKNDEAKEKDSDEPRKKKSKKGAEQQDVEVTKSSAEPTDSSSKKKDKKSRRKN
ncbi:hypothetical protein K402DRAFT_419334 [Aulographum hederae CBS 113979]|uniref:HMG box domain-containing protein n=1 Tax=Aulographum hederae CBS 113979 TaxID=1176131 RepID=A0A6G1H5Z6_9PEZI|nr:hypothetical protein K402DRAFT_419334 [Aulographum hederae CBS 113979]